MRRHTSQQIRHQFLRWRRRDAATTRARRLSKRGIKSHRLRWGTSCGCQIHDGVFLKGMPQLRRADDDLREQMAELLAETGA